MLILADFTLFYPILGLFTLIYVIFRQNAQIAHFAQFGHNLGKYTLKVVKMVKNSPIWHILGTTWAYIRQFM